MAIRLLASSCSRAVSRFWVHGLLVLGATLIGAVMISSLAPAASDEPPALAFPEHQLSREWRGQRPDLNFDHMFRADMPRQKSFQDAYRRPR